MDKRPADVYFTDMHTVPMGDSLQTKLRKLMLKAGIGTIDFKDKFVAVKLHFGEPGNLAFLRANYARTVCDLVKELGVEYLNVFAVDNVLQRMADPAFVGAVIRGDYPVGAKVVGKAAPDEKVGVLCLEDGRPSIVEYYELTEQMMYEKNPETGIPAYHYGVILNYLFRVREMEAIVDQNMPMHIVEKKIPHLDENGCLVKPDKPNGYKFETLVLDMIHMLDSCLAYEVVREKEFAPIKNPTGIDSVESARALLAKNGVTL